MKRLYTLELVGFYLLLGCSQNQQPKPNFLFIFTDDQTNESIRALNNPEVETPNMDKLVEQGVTFTHCFNQGSWSGAVVWLVVPCLSRGKRFSGFVRMKPI